jgi:hypothetical protein
VNSNYDDPARRKAKIEHRGKYFSFSQEEKERGIEREREREREREEASNVALEASYSPLAKLYIIGAKGRF